MWLNTRDGRRILDLYGGHAVAALGYGASRLDRGTHRAGRRLQLSEQCRADGGARARRRAPGALLASCPSSSVFFVNSGAEANENALEARISRHRAREDRRRSRAAFTGAPPPPARSPGARGRSGSDSRARRLMWLSSRAAHSLPSLRMLREDTAAVIVEPVQGVGGAFDMGAEFLAALRRRCDETGALADI